MNEFSQSRVKHRLIITIAILLVMVDQFLHRVSLSIKPFDKNLRGCYLLRAMILKKVGIVRDILVVIVPQRLWPREYFFEVS